MVYRVYVEKRPGLAVEAEALLSDIRHFLGITSISGLRLLNRYDVENIDRALFDEAKTTVFSGPQVDVTYDALPTADHVFGVEYLPGQYDQRADSAAQCIQIISQKPRPTVRTAKIYLINGDPTADDLQNTDSKLPRTQSHCHPPLRCNRPPEDPHRPVHHRSLPTGSVPDFHPGYN